MMRLGNLAGWQPNRGRTWQPLLRVHIYIYIYIYINSCTITLLVALRFTLALCKGAFARIFFIYFHLLFLCWLCRIGYLSLRRFGRPGKEPCNVGWKLWVHTFLWKTLIILLKWTVLIQWLEVGMYPFFPCVFTSKLNWSG
jgi:hypothetical protein